MKTAAIVLASVLSGNAYVLPGPAVAPMRTSGLAMQQEPPKAPKSGWSLTMAGGTRSVADVYADQRKAAKNSYQKKDVECDIERYEKGWPNSPPKRYQRQ